MDRSVYERMFVYESMVDILLDIIDGVDGSFISGKVKTFSRLSALNGLETRMGSLLRLVNEVSRQVVEVEGEEDELRIRAVRVQAAMRTAKDLVEEGTNILRVVERYKRLPMCGVLGVTRWSDGSGSSEDEAERDGYGRDSQEGICVDEMVEIIP
jgi:hypothetical protein